MILLLRFSAAYLVVAILIVLVFRSDPVNVLRSVWTSQVADIPVLAKLGAVFLFGSTVWAILSGSGSGRRTILAIPCAVIATLLFHSAMTLIKTSLPSILPFWADPVLASLDKALHFGVDPWEMAHAVAASLPVSGGLHLYMSVWVFPCVFLPVFMAAFDQDALRVRRYTILYVIAWVLIGNILALAGLSAGPVFYDRVLGGVRFSELTDALQNSAMNGSMLSQIQESLWLFYIEDGQSFGTGISAFPSVHLSMATVAALYVSERWIWMAPVGVAFVTGILFLSVYTGYHYAIDGYFSIVFMIVNWRWLQLKDERVLPKKLQAI